MGRSVVKAMYCKTEMLNVTFDQDGALRRLATLLISSLSFNLSFWLNRVICSIQGTYFGTFVQIPGYLGLAHPTPQEVTPTWNIKHHIDSWVWIGHTNILTENNTLNIIAKPIGPIFLWKFTQPLGRFMDG